MTKTSRRIGLAAFGLALAFAADNFLRAQSCDCSTPGHDYCSGGTAHHCKDLNPANGGCVGLESSFNSITQWFGGKPGGYYIHALTPLPCSITDDCTVLPDPSHPGQRICAPSGNPKNNNVNTPNAIDGDCYFS
jgi:hypothetical protein